MATCEAEVGGVTSGSGAVLALLSRRTAVVRASAAASAHVRGVRQARSMLSRPDVPWRSWRADFFFRIKASCSCVALAISLSHCVFLCLCVWLREGGRGSAHCRFFDEIYVCLLLSCAFCCVFAGRLVHR